VVVIIETESNEADPMMVPHRSASLQRRLSIATGGVGHPIPPNACCSCREYDHAADIACRGDDAFRVDLLVQAITFGIAARQQDIDDERGVFA
jgi:hypothetical protein